MGTSERRERQRAEVRASIRRVARELVVRKGSPA
jgi:hypothetical protein